jgi:hypothetical protein
MTEEQLNRGTQLIFEIKILVSRIEELSKLLGEVKDVELYLTEWDETIEEIDVDDAVVIKGNDEIYFIDELLKYRRQKLISLQKEFEKL